ncbi:MAG: HPr kinase/phosphorylase [Paracoccaceae bacterium]
MNSDDFGDDPVKHVMATVPGSCHASCVAINDRAVLIFGKSGAGKSTLALQLMALGACLVADDLVQISEQSQKLWVSHPKMTAQRNAIEARHFGILNVPTVTACELHCAIDMDVLETKRLPEERVVQFGNYFVRVFHKVDSPAFPAMVLQYLLHQTLE